MQSNPLAAVLTAALMLASGTALLGQSGSPGDLPTGWHIVRPGENLRMITEDYLGSDELWQDNWLLNPQIEDPNLLRPGQRLRVMIKTRDGVPSAQLVSVSGQVEGRPAPIDWNTALIEDLLVESDGIRTGNQSSTNLRFHDGTDLVVTEGSVVFLKVAGRTLEGIEKRSVEIVEGQADLAAAGGGGPATDIEFVIGDATATPKRGADGASEARLRKSDSGSAQLMVYEGESQLEAGGAKMAVATGMGTSVPEGGPPLPPEKLLPAPELVSPGPKGSIELTALDFAWSAVDGAAGYVVEVCADPACIDLIYRIVGLPDNEWRADALPLGEYYWRATAVSPSGLDGYPAEAQGVAIAEARAEFDPPTATFAIVGASVTANDITYYGPSAQVEPVLEDPAGVASWTPVVDGTPGAEADLMGPWSDGEHSVAVDAEDELGNSGRTDSVTFVVDAEPPSITWRRGDLSLLEETVTSAKSDASAGEWWRSRRARKNLKRARKQKPPAWSLLGWGNERAGEAKTFEQGVIIQELYRVHSSIRLEGDGPYALILSPALAYDEGSEDPGDFLIIEASDQSSGMEVLAIRTVGSKDEGYRLFAEARDRLGNISRSNWPFEVKKKRKRK